MSLLDMNEIDDFTIYKCKIEELLKNYWYGFSYLKVKRVDLILGDTLDNHDLLMWRISSSNTLELRVVSCWHRHDTVKVFGASYAELKVRSKVFNAVISVNWGDFRNYIEFGEL